MTGFDPELYLRILGERMLLSGRDWSHSHEPSPLVVAGQALVAAGCVEDAAVERVFDDYGLVAAVRGAALLDDALVQPVPATEPLAPRRIVRCERDLELASCTLYVRYLSLSEHSTELAVTMRMAPRAAAGARGLRGHAMVMLGGGPMTGPASVTLADDRGTKVGAHFSGGGSDTEWVGRLQAMQPLAPDTAYVEIDGERVDLRDSPPRGEVRIEAVPATDPALRHLWQAVTPQEHVGASPALEPAIDALVAAGAVTAEHPELADVRAVAEALRHGAMYGAPQTTARALPEPWRSLFRGRRGGAGPEGTITVGLATPVFDGFAVVVGAIESSSAGWRIDAEVAPAVAMFSPFEAPSPRPRHLTWWAADDRGHHYLGQMGNWSGGDESGHGEIEFAPALDEKASSIDLMPTANTHRAVISVPLDWGSA